MDYQVQALDAPHTLTTKGNRRDRKNKDALLGIYSFSTAIARVVDIFTYPPGLSVLSQHGQLGWSGAD